MVQIDSYNKRLSYLLLFFVFFLAVLGAKLFYLQVIRHGYYLDKALSDHQGYTELQSRRGEIYVRDYHSDNAFKVATNTSLSTVFADPSLVLDPQLVAKNLYLPLFKEKDALKTEELRIEELRKDLSLDLTEEEMAELLQPKTLEELRLEFRDEIMSKISQQQRQEIVLIENPDSTLRSRVQALGLSGVEVFKTKIVVYPPKITNQKSIALRLAPVVDMNPKRLQELLAGVNRYVVLATRIEGSNIKKIEELRDQDPKQYKGIGFEEHDYRYYPEGELSAAAVGFLNSDNEGIYGIEEYYNTLLQGEEGIFKTKLDAFGKQITVGSDTIIKPAKDGADVYLTIERSIQMKAEEVIERAVHYTDADSGELLVMDPYTGEMLAMAQYPKFELNHFWEALETEEVDLEKLVRTDIFYAHRDIYENLSDVVIDDEVMAKEIEDRMFEFNYGEIPEQYFTINKVNHKEIRILPIPNENDETFRYETYKNGVGPGAYKNNSVVGVYEPGSVFKPITMSGAIDDELVTPNTTMVDNGPVKVDEFTIENAMLVHYGVQTMTNVLENSNNIGMVWVAQKMGRGLLGSYIKKYGFGRMTEIQLPNEKAGKVRPHSTWTDSELATAAFGQGLTVTPVQMITAFSAIANGGKLMQPTVVEKIVHEDGLVDEFEPTIVKQVLSKKSADMVSAMLRSVVHKGQADKAIVDGYWVAGKTGTSQTYRNGIPLRGRGTTIATFAGYAPASDPQFVVLVKLNRPRSSEWGSIVAAPVFSEITQYILQYLNIAPDRV